MAQYLYRLGRFAHRRRRLVTALWLGLLVVSGVAAATLSGPTANGLSVPGTEAQRAIDMLDDRFPQAAADGATARVVFAAPDGRRLTEAELRAGIEQAVAGLRTVPDVAGVADPFTARAINPAGTVGYAQVTFRVAAADLGEEARDGLTRAAGAGRDAGLTVEIGGDAIEASSEQRLQEVIGVGVAAVVLVITFGSLIAAGLPLLTALLGIAVSLTGIIAATGFVDLSASIVTLAIMIGLAVAIDYSLFILIRYRYEFSRTPDAREAAGRAVGTAGSAVVFAGLTVVIVLSGLWVVGIPFLTQAGLAAAATVIVAVLIALTLLPALIGFAGGRVLGRRRADTRGQVPEDRGAAPVRPSRWARLVTRHPVITLAAAAIGLMVIAVPALGLRLGLPDDGIAPPDSTQRKAYDLLAEGFGPGFNGPLILVVDTAGSGDPQGAVRQVSATVSGLPGVAAVTPPAVNPAGDTALLTVVPRGAPSSRQTADLVADIRDQGAGLRATTGAGVAVTGLTALNIDMSEKLAEAMVPYLALVVGLAIILLALVFRSVLIPVKATLGFLLSIAATFGAVVAVFQWGWLAGLFGVTQTAPILSALPIFLIGVVFGLAMDYQIFLVTRMREAYVRGAEPTNAIVTGFGHSARVVTAAAIIMAAVFSGFILSPDLLVKSIGFALAGATLFDAFVVRMTIVPAALTLLGHRAWWLPRWLDRALPDIDVEGRALEEPVEDDVERQEPRPAAV
ncbi:MMPL family transporter [Actinomadura alba]|uniref:MMPL family transporter n=1 Tax=Actinomadura alba TaxID=406431 RepID=A0ABR7LNI7_9ACTN|nr:MMPL family transporter [Actinomadura alba]MBC6466403.1 MMPL family transporter [Actinomadura alba]